LIEAIDANFTGHEDLLAEIRSLPGKWGNGDPATDALAAEVMGALFAEAHRHRSPKGAPFVAHAISMITHTLDGRLSIASPDGRRAGVPFAASCNPANVERAGVTAALRSVAALPNVDLMGSAVNVKFHPTAVGANREARAKWASLVRTYFRLGGAQIQPTCVSAEMLREARANPGAHRDLIVKVGGYSTYFVDLGREIQQEIIDRTEHGGAA
jgi:formate C-acetyltransferase